MGPVCVALLARRFRGDTVARAGEWASAAIVMAVLLNPRLQDYDADIAVIPAVFLLVQVLRRSPWSRMNPFGLALIASGYALLVAKTDSLGLLVALLASVGFFVMQPWARRASMSEPMQQEMPELVNAAP
jgi:hypothetical protein